MSEIQSIAQNNYILHNIDAKKLYVQEPLFTANSGDAVYVGWRPDETVLWDGGTSDLTVGNTAQLLEPFSSFEKIEMWCVWNPWTGNVPQATYYPGNATAGSYMVFDQSQYMRAGYGKWTVNGTTLTLASASQTTTWPTFNTGTTLGGIRKVIGINRKENA